MKNKIVHASKKNGKIVRTNIKDRKFILDSTASPEPVGGLLANTHTSTHKHTQAHTHNTHTHTLSLSRSLSLTLALSLSLSLALFVSLSQTLS